MGGADTKNPYTGKSPNDMMAEAQSEISSKLGSKPIPTDAADDALTVEKKRRAMMVAFKDPGQITAPRGLPKAVGALPTPMPNMGGVLGVK